MFGVPADVCDASTSSGEVTSPVVLPDGLAQLPPGLRLAEVLESVDFHRCTSADVFTLLQAQARQVAHDEGRLLAMRLEAARADRADAVGVVKRRGVPVGPLDAAGLGRTRELDDMCGDQIAFA